MNETIQSPIPDAPKKSNTGLIIGIVVAVVLCCCCVLAIAGWYFGDTLLYQLGIY